MAQSCPQTAPSFHRPTQKGDASKLSNLAKGMPTVQQRICSRPERTASLRRRHAAGQHCSIWLNALRELLCCTRRARETCHKRELLPHEVWSIAIDVVLQPLALSNELLAYFILLLLVLPAVVPADSAHAHACQTNLLRLGTKHLKGFFQLSPLGPLLGPNSRQ